MTEVYYLQWHDEDQDKEIIEDARSFKYHTALTGSPEDLEISEDRFSSIFEKVYESEDDLSVAEIFSGLGHGKRDAPEDFEEDDHRMMCGGDVIKVNGKYWLRCSVGWELITVK